MDPSTPDQKKPTYVYTLSYMRPLPENGHFAGMWVGVYTTAAKAEAAIARLKQRPGFCDYPDGFDLQCVRTDEEYDEPLFFTHWKPPSPE